MSYIESKLSILFVDDSSTVRTSAVKLLEKFCHIRTAKDSFDAFIKLSEAEVDIIFMDIMMPKMDGYQACALIKNNEEYKDIPLILVSSNTGLLDKAKGRIVGCDDYITKPFSEKILIDTINKFSNERRNSGVSEWQSQKQIKNL